ncbi:hypothetical protein G6F40_015120 [Rhizopus arrhizus]|nr:hypothetical protein G6F40_015120 [Rhizopus arrhizus]
MSAGLGLRRAALAKFQQADACQGGRRGEQAATPGVDRLGQLRQRFLPAQVAHLGRNDGRDAFLHDADVGAAGDLAQRDPARRAGPYPDRGATGHRQTWDRAGA